MAHFYSEIQGNRGEATRMGTKKSGIYGHIRGWNIGIEVQGFVDEDGKDTFYVMLTGGSNGNKKHKHVGHVFREGDL